MSPEPIYLDNAATTRPLDSVLDRMSEVARQHFGNPSSTHQAGDGPRRLLHDAREFLRGSLGAAELVFTSGGTEADMLAVLGAAAARPPGRVLAASDDHPAVLALEGELAARRHRLTKVPVTEHGDIDPETLFDMLGTDVRVVSILHGHNELGTLADLEELLSLVRRVSPEAHIHVDLVQSYGKIDFDLDLMEVDSVAVSAHKLHGPRGVGFLALSSKARIAPIVAGGGQEGGMRGGTENVAGACGLATAAEHMLSHLEEYAHHMNACADAVFDGVLEAFPEARRLGHPERRLPHVLSMRIPGVQGHALQQAMNARGIAFSTGSACHATDGSGPENPVLRAIGLSRRAASEVVRISFAHDTDLADVDRAVDLLCEEAQRLHAQRAQGSSRSRPSRRAGTRRRAPSPPHDRSTREAE